MVLALVGFLLASSLLSSILSKNNNISLIEEKDEFHKKLILFLIEISSHVSYGLDKENRYIPLTLSTSLIPTAFPQHNIIEFMASIVPSF